MRPKQGLMMTSPFQLLLHVREKLYKSGIFRTHRLNHPVISIGNLTLGGTGKTPLTIFLAEQMREEGLRPVVLSRGYRRKSRGAVVVSRGAGPIVPWEDAGDEPYLMARRLSGKAAVVVGESRYLAGLRAESEKLGNLFILDDGFQHRQLNRDVDIVTIDPVEWRAGESLLPMGRWREPKSALARADAACVMNDRLDLPIPQFKTSLEVEDIFDGDTRVPLPELAGRSITAFAGIAKPERFFATLDSIGLRIAKKVPFPDHHAFTDDELRSLGGDVRLTTEKDAVKLEKRGRFLALRVSVNISGFDRLRDLILKRLSASNLKNAGG
jgi:tetraacyldisaccharide 4'-kinase